MKLINLYLFTNIILLSIDKNILSTHGKLVEHNSFLERKFNFEMLNSNATNNTNNITTPGTKKVNSKTNPTSKKNMNNPAANKIQTTTSNTKSQNNISVIMKNNSTNNSIQNENPVTNKKMNITNVENERSKSSLGKKIENNQTVNTSLGKTSNNNTKLEIKTNSTNSIRQTDKGIPITEAKQLISPSEDLANSIKKHTYVKRILKDVKFLLNEINSKENPDQKIRTSDNGEFRWVLNIDKDLIVSEYNSENRLNNIQNKILRQLKNSLVSEMSELHKEISEMQYSLKKTESKIKEIKVLLPTVQSFCSIFTSCDSCIANKCGWCGSSYQCVEGNEKGPKGGLCSGYETTCSPPKECEVHTDCNNCINDINCGWCKGPKPVCMKKEDGDQGKCNEDSLIHQYRILNTCENSLKKSLNKNKNDNSLDLKSLKLKNPLDFDPLTRKKLMSKLTSLQEEKSKKEYILRNLKQAFNAMLQENSIYIDETKLNFATDKKFDKKRYFTTKNKYGFVLNDPYDIGKDDNIYESNYKLESLKFQLNKNNLTNITKNESNILNNITNQTKQFSNQTLKSGGKNKTTKGKVTNSTKVSAIASNNTKIQNNTQSEPINNTTNNLKPVVPPNPPKTVSKTANIPAQPAPKVATKPATNKTPTNSPGIPKSPNNSPNSPNAPIKNTNTTNNSTDADTTLKKKPMFIEINTELSEIHKFM